MGEGRVGVISPVGPTGQIRAPFLRTHRRQSFLRNSPERNAHGGSVGASDRNIRVTETAFRDRIQPFRDTDSLQNPE
jgi:hypothetical protein